MKSIEERFKALEIDNRNHYNAITRLETVKDKQRREIIILKWIVFLLTLNVVFMPLLLISEQPQVAYVFLLFGLGLIGLKATVDTFKTK